MLLPDNAAFQRLPPTTAVLDTFRCSSQRLLLLLQASLCPHLHCRQPLGEALDLGHVLVVVEVLQQLADRLQQVGAALVLVTPVAHLHSTRSACPKSQPLTA